MNEIQQDTMDKAARGDQKAFRLLYDTYSGFVWRIVFRTTGADQDLSTEIMQETFIRIYRSLKKFDRNAAPSTWIYRIAYNTAMIWLERKSKRNRSSAVLDEKMQSQDRADAYDTRQLVAMVLGSLKPEDRFLLTAREVDGLSFEELTTITGIKEGALRTRLHRLKETIGKQFSDTNASRPREHSNEREGTAVLSGTGTGS